MAAVARNVLSVELHRNEPRLYYVIYGPRPRFKCMQSNRAYARPSLSLCIAGCSTFPIFSSLSLSPVFSVVASRDLLVPLCADLFTYAQRASGTRSTGLVTRAFFFRVSSRVVRTCSACGRIWSTPRVKTRIVDHSSDSLVGSTWSLRQNFRHSSVHVAGTWTSVPLEIFPRERGKSPSNLVSAD